MPGRLAARHYHLAGAARTSRLRAAGRRSRGARGPARPASRGARVRARGRRSGRGPHLSAPRRGGRARPSPSARARPARRAQPPRRGIGDRAAAHGPRVRRRPRSLGTGGGARPDRRRAARHAGRLQPSLLRVRRPGLARPARGGGPAARFAIVGAGPRREQPHAPARRLGLDREERFAFLPFQPPAARYLKALDVYVLPSAWEGLPIGALEALACGVPQIATDVEGTGEAVAHDHTGLLLPPDASGLAESMVALLGDEQRRRAMSEASRTLQRERFGVGRMVAETARVYEGALAE